MITQKMRRNFTTAILCCLTLFCFSFLYSLAYGGPENGGAVMNADRPIYGLQPVAAASASPGSLDVHTMSSAVASLSDPFLLKVGPIHTISDYMLAISLIGMVSTLLILNWLSRTRV
jgi:hypothetical protein